MNLTLALVAINGANRLNVAFRTVPGSHQVRRRGDDFRDTGFVVGAEQRRSGCGDDVAPHLIGERRDGLFLLTHEDSSTHSPAKSARGAECCIKT